MSVYGSGNGLSGRPNTTPVISSIRVIKKRPAQQQQHHALLTSSSRESTLPSSNTSCSLQMIDSGDDRGSRYAGPSHLDDEVIAEVAMALSTSGNTPTRPPGRSSQATVDRYASSVVDEVDEATPMRQRSLQMTDSEADRPLSDSEEPCDDAARRPQSALPTIHESDRIGTTSARQAISPAAVPPPPPPGAGPQKGEPKPAAPRKIVPSVRPVTQASKQPVASRRPSSDPATAVAPKAIPVRTTTTKTKSATAASKQQPPPPSTSGPSPALPPPPPAPTAANRVMNVSISRKAVIGKGSFGVVYQAMDRNTNHIIACKEVCLVRSGSSGDPVPLIRQELSLLKQLDHPNIVKCLGEDHDDKYLRIYMEYVTGGSIHSILRMFGTLQERQASNFTKQVLEGLKYLHDRHICHRDLKGDNLLVDTQGVLKLADFGTAKELLTQATSVAGTAYFMAPEVIQGVGHGVEADVWSVGCCVIEMLTGKPPFSHLKNQYAIMMHVAGGSAGGGGNAIDEVLPAGHQFSTAAVQFLTRCFPRKPSERATATQLLKDPWILSPPNPAAGVDDGRPFIDAGSIHLAGQQTIREAQTMTRDEVQRLQSNTATAADPMNSVNPLALCDDEDDHVLGEW